MSLDDKQYLLSQLSPPWMSTRQGSTDTPEWVDRDEVDNFLQQARSMQSPMSAGFMEHVIPMGLEKTPKTPATPGFGPTPFYGAANQQFNNVVSPKVGECLDCMFTDSLSFLINEFTSRSTCESICQSRIQQH